MTISIRDWGAPASGSSAATPGNPAGVASDDVSVLIVHAFPSSATISTPAGWTSVGSSVVHVSTVDTFAAVFTHLGTLSGSTTATASGGTWVKARIITYQKDTALPWSWTLLTGAYTYGPGAAPGTGLFLTLLTDALVPAGLVTGTSTAYNATVVTGTLANPQVASDSALAYNATTKVANIAQAVVVSTTTYNAAAVTGTLAYAQVVTITATANNSNRATSSNAQSAAAIASTVYAATVAKARLAFAETALIRASVPDITTPIGSKSSTAFIISMLQPLVQATTFSAITPTTDYADSYIGAVTGTFNKLGSPRLTEQLCPITITDPPGVLSDAFRGTVTGTVSGLAGSVLYMVLAYKRTDIDYNMGAFGNVDASGNFSISLAGVSTDQAGEWRFACVLRTTALGQVGLMWPQPVSFVGLAVESSVITDTRHLTLSQPASADSTFRFTYSAVGRKQFRLVDTVTNAIIADYTPLTGCVRSYVVEADQPGYGTYLAEQCYVQDQGVALSTMLAIGDLTTAELMADGLLLMQTSGGLYDGGFIYSARQLSPAYGTATYRTGTHATALYALLRFIAIAPHGGRAVYVLAAQRALDYLNRQLSASGDLTGLYLGGSGVFSSEISYSKRVNQAYEVTWADTESNLNVWWALYHAGLLFGEPYRSRASALRDKIISLLWNSALGHFNRGYTNTSGPDTVDTLMAHTLGAIWLQANDYDTLASATLANSQLSIFFRATSNGYQGYSPVVAY